MVDIKNIRKSICEIGELLYDRELTDSSGRNPKADFSIHRRFTKEEIASIDESKEVCIPGYVYKGTSGDIATYDGRQSGDFEFSKDIVDEITEKVIKQLKK